MVYPEFCYQQSITLKLTELTVDGAVQIAWMYVAYLG